MQLYTADFIGHYPVGTAAVVAAESPQAARQALYMALPSALAAQNNVWDLNVREWNPETEPVRIQHDGSY